MQGGIGELSTMDYVNIQVEESDVVADQKILAEYENNQDQVTEPKNIEKTPTVIKAFLGILTFSFIFYLYWMLKGL